MQKERKDLAKNTCFAQLDLSGFPSYNKMSDIDPSKMKVTELRDELKKHGLDTKGKKEQLVKRLEKFLSGGEGGVLLTTYLFAMLHETCFIVSGTVATHGVKSPSYLCVPLSVALIDYSK